MSHARTIVFLGILVAVFPLLGFPPLWETIVIFFAGAAITVLAFLDALAERLERQMAEDTHRFVQKQDRTPEKPTRPRMGEMRAQKQSPDSEKPAEDLSVTTPEETDDESSQHNPEAT